MGTCAICHNRYDKTFDIIQAGRAYTFDCFECAIQALAPTCLGCGCRIIGHGVEHDDKYFCGAHCAHYAGVAEARDRV